MPEQGSAHMLLLGDSTDKLWMFQMCSDRLPPEQQCRFAGPCPPSHKNVPNNLQPFACVDGDSRCKAATCFPEDGATCFLKDEWMAQAPRASLSILTRPPSDSCMSLIRI